MKIAEPQVMMDFHRHIYLIVKEATKHTHFIRYEAKHLRVEKMLNKDREKNLKYVVYDVKTLAERWLSKVKQGTTITDGAKDVLTQAMNTSTNKLF